MAEPSESQPTFFLIGAAKAGTTSLYAYLAQHPAICFSNVKEPHFFDDSSKYARGPHWYVQQYFSRCQRYPVRCDATPMLHLPQIVAPRLATTYDVKAKELQFVAILRDPVERAWSHYLDRIGFVSETETFSRALELEEERLELSDLSWTGYFRDGLYAAQIDSWLTHFSREQFLFLLNEDLKRDPAAVVRQVFTFLGVNPKFTVDTSFETNTASQPRSRTLMHMISHPPRLGQQIARMLFPVQRRRQIRALLRRQLSKSYTEKPELPCNVARALRLRYQADIERLEVVIGRDLSAWRTQGIVPLEEKS